MMTAPVSASVAPPAAAGRLEPPSASAVARALGRVEARQMKRSVWFAVGIAFCALLVVLFTFVFSGDAGEAWDYVMQLSPWLAYPLVGMTVLAAHRAATRAGRDGTDELYETCPAAPTTRTWGFLLAGVAPVVALAIFLPVFFIATAMHGTGHFGPLSIGNLAEVLAALVLGAGGVALGVALGRWIKFPLAPVFALVAILMLTVKINGIGDPGWNPFAALTTAPALSDAAPVFTDRPVWWHLLWVVALTVGVGVAAIARHRRDRQVAAVAVVAVVVAMTAAIGAVQPPTRAAELAALVSEPATHQRCAAVPAVRVCVYRPYAELLDRYVARLRPVAGALPAGMTPVTLREVFNADVADLPPAVRRLIPHNPPWLAPGEMRIGYTSSPLDVDDAALDVALRSVGLPPNPDDAGVPTVAAGQARGVVALWVATRGLSSQAAHAIATSRDPASGDPFVRGSTDKDPCAVASVVWSGQDLAAARALMDKPEDAVMAVLQSRWAHWADPATGTDELMGALGINPVGPIDHVTAQPSGSC